jgi:peptide/nickel transport system permease protein
MVILVKIVSKLVFGLLFFIFIFLFLSRIAPDNSARFDNYIRTIEQSSSQDDRVSLSQDTGAQEPVYGFWKQFGVWTKEMVIMRNRWGLTQDRTRLILDELSRALPFTIVLVAMTIALIIVISIFLSYLITSNLPWRVKNSFETLLEVISSIPEFLFCFLLIIIFAKHLIPVYCDRFAVFPQDFEQFLEVLGYMFLPAIALAFANGSVSTLTKYLTNRIKSIRRCQYYVFLEANGTRHIYLDHIIVFKELLPLMIRFISMKLPLIIGSSIVIERIFDIQGISNRAFQYFKGLDNGVILAIFVIVYLTTAFSDVFTEVINTFINPERNKTN